MVPARDGAVRGLAVSPNDCTAHLRVDTDVWDAHLRVSGIVEWFWPARELVREITTRILSCLVINRARRSVFACGARANGS